LSVSFGAPWRARGAVRQTDVTTVRLDDLLSQNQLGLERALEQMLAEHSKQSRQPRLLTVGEPPDEPSGELPVRLVFHKPGVYTPGFFVV
jgi:hypothetical protein